VHHGIMLLLLLLMLVDLRRPGVGIVEGLLL
jgi:hypothetical protein